MGLGQHLTPERVVFVQGLTKQAVLEEMVDVLAGEAEGVNRDQISQAVWRREGLMSTGIGHGLAIPHVRLPGLTSPVMVAGICPKGVDGYESLDNEPVGIIIMIAAPQGQHETYIRLLAKVLDVLKQPEVSRQVVEAGDPAQAHRIITGESARREATP